MVDPHPLPPGLEPDPHEHGLASGDLAALAADIDRAWELFESVAAAGRSRMRRRARAAGRLAS